MKRRCTTGRMTEAVSPGAARTRRRIPSSGAAHLDADLTALLASPDICSKRWIWEQYDYTVRTNTVEGPGADAADHAHQGDRHVDRDVAGRQRPLLCAVDPREGAKLIVAECCRNLSTAGALPVAATNNLNFGNPERPEIMAQLVESIEGMAEACQFFETPITGGNVSLYNETWAKAIFPTPGDGHRGADEDGAADANPFPERRAAP